MEMSHAFHMTGDYLFAVKFHFFAAIASLLLCKKKGNLPLLLHFNFVVAIEFLPLAKIIII